MLGGVVPCIECVMNTTLLEALLINWAHTCESDQLSKFWFHS